MVFEKIYSEGFEQVVFCNDPSVGLKAIISIHSSVLGPALGGCRVWDYASETEALFDALRLAKGMTYKAALAGLEWGGGKAVIMIDSKKTTDKLFQRFGEYVNRLNGHYITAKDVGISAENLRMIKTKTPHIVGIEGEEGSGGDPSIATAVGVYHGMRACARYVFGSESLDGMKIALQGLGSVSYFLLEYLIGEGAQVIGCDIDMGAIEKVLKKYNIEIVSPDRIESVECDIFSPSALGGAINARSLASLKAKIVAGAANNQLATAHEGYELLRRGIVYAPDYAINAGGLINVYYEDGQTKHYDQERAFAHIARIGRTIEDILHRAQEEKLPTHVVADRIVEEKLRDSHGRRDG